jgi:hypothetical protein
MVLPLGFWSLNCEYPMRILWLVTVSALSIIPAQAGPAGDALSAVAKCSEITATAERLQCFDAAAVSAKAVLAAAQQPAAQESEGGLLAWFGLAPEQKPVTKPEDFGVRPGIVAEENRPPELSEISATVVEYAKNAHGKSLFILDNGQVWKQVDGDTTELFRRSSDPDMKITIEKAIMGSFSLRIEGRTGMIKVRRVK